MLASVNSSMALDLSNLIVAMEQLLHGVDERMGAAMTQATRLPDSEHAEAAKDVVRSFPANLGMLK